MKSLTVTLLGSVLVLASTLAASAQTSWTGNGDGISWSDNANWTAQSPVTIGSGAVVQIGSLPSQGGIVVDTGGPTSIASLDFTGGLTGSTELTTDGTSTLQVNGSITNSSTANQVMDISTIAGSSATYTGGSSGLTFGNLTVNTNDVATSGNIAVNGKLIVAINSSSAFGQLGSATNSTITFGNGSVINVTGTYTGTLGDSFKLVNGNFSGATLGTLPTLSSGLSWNTSNFATDGTISVTAPADQSLTGPTPSTINIITGATTTVGATLNNTAGTGANTLAVGLADNGSTGGTISSLSAASGSNVAANSSTSVTGTLTAGAAGTGKTWSITNTDPNALTPTVSAGGTVNVYTHASGVLGVTSATTVGAIAGTTITSTLTYSNSGTTNDKLAVQSTSGGVTGISGTFTGGQTATGTGSFVAGAAGNTTTHNYTVTSLEDQTVIGATAGNQDATAGVTVTSYSHADGTLVVTTPTTVKAIAGATVNSTMSFTNNGATNDSLNVISTTGGITGVSGTFTGNQSVTNATGSATAGAAGGSTTHSYTVNWQEDQSILGATAGTQTSTASVTIDSFTHANGSVAVTSPTTIKAITGTTINSTLTFSNTGATNDDLTVQSTSGGITGVSGTFSGNQSVTNATGSFVAGAAGTTTSHDYSVTWLEDQSVIGATAGNQTSTASVTVDSFTNASGALGVTSPTTIKAITGTTVTSNLTFSNSNATNDALTVQSTSGGVSGVSGTFSGGQSVTTATGSTTAGAAGTSTTHNYTVTWLEDQSVLGSVAGNQDSTASITIDSFTHAAAALGVTSATSIKAIAGSTINSTLTFGNSGATNDNLSIVSTTGGLTGVSGTFTGNQSTNANGSFTAGAAGTSTSHTYSVTWLEDQTVVGATAGNQTTTADVSVDSFSHASGILAVTTPTTVTAITGATVTSTLAFSNSGGTNDDLTVQSLGGGLTGISGTFTANQSVANASGSVTAGAAGSSSTHDYTVTWLEDQTVVGATAGNQTSTASVTVNAVNHSAASLSSATDNFGFVHVGGTVANATTDLQNAAGSNAALQIVDLDGLNPSGSGLIAAGGSRTLSASSIDTSAAGTVNNTYTIKTEDDQSVVGANSGNPDLTFTVTGEIYSGQGVWNVNGGGSWGTVASGFGTNWGANQGSPGLDAGFVDTDTATFDNTALAVGSSATITLDGASPSLKGITFDTTGGSSYTIAQGTTGTIKLNNGSSIAAINDLSGNHTISAPIELDGIGGAGALNVGDILTISGNITEAGGSRDFYVGGAGTVLLTGSAAYTGSTAILNGTLQLGSSGGLASSVVVLGSSNKSAVLALGNGGTAVTQTLTSLSINGTGTANAVVGGGTAVSTLKMTNAANLAYSGLLGGSDTNQNNLALLANGTGGLELDGANTFTGGTTVNSGILKVGNASALGGGNVTINSGGTLQTNGTQHVINIGTASSTANYTQVDGGNLVLNINSAAGNNPGVDDTNDVLKVTGTASLNGTLQLNFVASQNFHPATGDQFTVVEANLNNLAGTNGITALGDNFVNPMVTPSNGFTVSTSETLNGNNLVITVDTIQLTLASVPGLTPNQASTANYIDTYIPASSPLGTAFIAEASAGPQSVAESLNQVSPEKFANFLSSNIFNNATFGNQQLMGYLNGQHSPQGDFVANNTTLDSSGFSMLDPTMDSSLAQTQSRLLAWNPAPVGHGLLSDTADSTLAGVDMKDTSANVTRTETAQPWNAFVVGSAILGQNFSQADLPHSNTTTGTVQIGAGFRVTPHLRVGALFGYGHTHADLDNNGSEATSDTYSPGVFVSYADSGWYANTIASYGFDNFTEDRHSSLIGLSGVSHGTPNGNQMVAAFNGGYDFRKGNWTFGPSAGVQYTHMNVDGYSETGAPAFDLSVAGQQSDSLRSLLGGHVGYVFQTGTVFITPHLDVSWQHEFMDQSRGVTSQFNSVGAGSFTVNTPNPSRDSALVDLGISADLNRRLTLFGDYMAQAGQSNYFGQSLSLGLRYGF